jgi:hypothetical protein
MPANKAKLGRQCHTETEKIIEKLPKMSEKWSKMAVKKRRDKALISLDHTANFARKIFENGA